MKQKKSIWGYFRIITNRVADQSVVFQSTKGQKGDESAGRRKERRRKTDQEENTRNGKNIDSVRGSEIDCKGKTTRPWGKQKWYLQLAAEIAWVRIERSFSQSRTLTFEILFKPNPVVAILWDLKASKRKKKVSYTQIKTGISLNEKNKKRFEIACVCLCLWI